MLRIVHTGCGAIEGIAAPEPEITVFRGIPFAAPPVGDLRWRAPQPVAAWAGTLAAHDFAPACPQPTPGDSNEFYDREWGTDPAIALDEDCLYLKESRTRSRSCWATPPVNSWKPTPTAPCCPRARSATSN